MIFVTTFLQLPWMIFAWEVLQRHHFIWERSIVSYLITWPEYAVFVFLFSFWLLPLVCVFLVFCILMLYVQEGCSSVQLMKMVMGSNEKQIVRDSHTGWSEALSSVVASAVPGLSASGAVMRTSYLPSSAAFLSWKLQGKRSRDLGWSCVTCSGKPALLPEAVSSDIRWPTFLLCLFYYFLKTFLEM